MVSQNKGKISFSDFYKSVDQNDPQSLILVNKFRQDFVKEFKERKKKGEEVNTEDYKNIQAS